MKYLLLPCLFLFAFCSSNRTVPAESASNASVSTEVIATPGSNAQFSTMLGAAQAFVASLDEPLRKDALFPFDDPEKYNIHFTPVPRQGADLRDMNPQQRARVTALLQSVLSDEGYRKATEIMELERVLKVLEKRADDDDHRDPEKYFVLIFGDPSATEPWGFRFEGHHLCLNFSSVTGEVAVTPAFFATNPAIVREGPQKGKEVLKLEQDLGRKLVTMMDASQRKRVIISPEAPADIITGVDRKASLERFEGIPAADMTPAQREVLWELMGVYLGNMEASIAEKRMARINQIELKDLYFAWAGSIEVGEAHYYRIHAPELIIEYDNIQNNANHIHTTWRDPLNDFGDDLLRKHYEAHKH